MSSTDQKRRGRPPREAAVETPVVEVEHEVEPEHDEPAPSSAKPATPCWRCGKPLQRSTTLLKAYGMAVLRCPGCRHVAIEGDPRDEWRDEETAKAGRPPAVVARAASIHRERNPFTPLPGDARNGMEAAIHSEWGDARWDEYEF
jgi:hypothetical protein